MTGKGTRGFVLVNALVLVAALAAVAVVLLARAEQGRQRQAQMQTSAQLGYYLDAFEALSVTLLARDQLGDASDHLQEDWAQASYDVPLDRGAVAGSIRDLQGNFNINALTNPDDQFVRQGFDRLLEGLGLSSALGDAIVAHLVPRGAVRISGDAGNSPASARLGGPILMLDELHDIPGLRDEDLARLFPYVAALPGHMALNVNTAPARVLQSLFPQISPAVMDRLVQDRRSTPFISAEDFQERMIAFGAVEAAAALDLARITVSSRWFVAEMTATLDDHRRHRVTVFERTPLPGGPQVAFRVTDPY